MDDAAVVLLAVLSDELSSVHNCMHKRAICIEAPTAHLARIISIGIVIDHIPVACVARLHCALLLVIVINGIVRSLLTVILYCFLVSVGGSDGVIGIEVITEFEVWDEGLRAVCEQAVLHGLCVMVIHMQCTAEMIILSNVVVDEIGIEVHLQSALPVGH